MTPYEAYILYIGVKTHFTQKRFNWKTNRPKASFEKFEKRPDKLFFHRLAKVNDPVAFLTSNFIKNPSAWVGDLVISKKSIQILLNDHKLLWCDHKPAQLF